MGPALQKAGRAGHGSLFVDLEGSHQIPEPRDRVRVVLVRWELLPDRKCRSTALYQDDGRVLYRGTRFHPRIGRDYQLVSDVEFLALLVPHIALRYECRIGDRKSRPKSNGA
jgi:hypothetical protein